MASVTCTALQSPPASVSPKAVTEPSVFNRANAPLLEMIWTSPTSPWKWPPATWHFSYVQQLISTIKKKKSKWKCRANGFVEYLKMDIGNYFRKILFKSVDFLINFQDPTERKRCFSCKVYLKIINLRSLSGWSCCKWTYGMFKVVLSSRIPLSLTKVFIDILGLILQNFPNHPSPTTS